MGKECDTYTWVVISEVIKQTEKAVLIRANGQTWLPKSQVEIYEVDEKNMSDIPYSSRHYFAHIPSWLYNQNRPCFGWIESPTFQLPECAIRICA